MGWNTTAVPHNLTSIMIAQADLLYLQLDGDNAMSGVLDMGSNLISNVTDPIGAQDAATRNFVLTQGFLTAEVDPLSLAVLNNLSDLNNVATARSNLSVYSQSELDGGQLDGQYFQESEFLDSSAGAGDAGKPVKLDAAGILNSNMLPPLAGDFKADGSVAMTGDFNIASSNIVSTGEFSLESNSNSDQLVLKTDGTLKIDGMSIQGPTSGPADSFIFGDIPSGLVGTRNILIGSIPGALLTTGDFNVAIGGKHVLAVAGSGSNRNTAVGDTAARSTTTADRIAVYGFGAGFGSETLVKATAIGASSLNQVTSATDVLFLGHNAGNSIDWGTISDIIVMGTNSRLSETGATSEMVIGAQNNAIADYYYGQGGTSTLPNVDVTHIPSNASGTDISSTGDHIFAGGRGTGTGVGSHVLIQTADAGSTGASLNALATIAEFTDDSKIGFYGVTPVAQASKVSDPSGGGTVDAESRTAIDAIIDILEGLGIAASV